jgi:superfamily II DNA/RNA helicase
VGIETIVRRATSPRAHTAPYQSTNPGAMHLSPLPYHPTARAGLLRPCAAAPAGKAARGAGGNGGGRRTADNPRPPTREELEMDVEDMFLDDDEAAELRRQLRRQSGGSLAERAEALRKEGAGSFAAGRRGSTRRDSGDRDRDRDRDDDRRGGRGGGRRGRDEDFGGTREEEDEEGTRKPKPIQAPPPPPAAAAFFAPKSWADVGATAEASDALRSLGFPRPSHVQAASFPALLAVRGGGNSSSSGGASATLPPPPLFPHVAVADQAGSGKTLAYLAPLLQELREEERRLLEASAGGNGNGFGGGAGAPATRARSPRLVVLAPTAELAQQVAAVARRLSEAGLRHRRAVVTGGEADRGERQKRFRTQRELLGAGVDLVVATPGRLLEHWKRGSLDFSAVKAVVLDEVDVLCAGDPSSGGAAAMGGAPRGSAGAGHRDAVGPLIEAARREATQAMAVAASRQQQREEKRVEPKVSSPAASATDLSAALADAFRPAAAAARDDDDDADNYALLLQQQNQQQQHQGPRFVLVSATIPAGALASLRDLFPGLVGAFGPGLHCTSPGLREELVDCSGGSGEFSLESGNARKLSALRRALRRVGAERAVVFCNKLETCRLVENAMRRWRDAALAGGGAGGEEEEEEGDEDEDEDEDDGGGNDDLLRRQHEPLAYHEAVRDELRKANLARFLEPPPPVADDDAGAAESSSAAAALEVAAATSAARGRRPLFGAAAGPPPPLALVCTDRASRGIDTSSCGHVVLFDFPRDPSEYVRRVGRTARGARGQGVATILALGRQVPLAREVLARTTARAPVHRVPDVLPASASAANGAGNVGAAMAEGRRKVGDGGGGGRGGGRGRGGGYGGGGRGGGGGGRR